MIEARTLDGLKQLLADHDRVVVDFWSPTCGPCKAFLPTFEKVEGDLHKALSEAKEGIKPVLFVKVNITEASDVIKEFGLKAVPTILGFKDGEKVKDKTGLMNEQAFFTFVSEIN